ncbi:MAG: hypothetical protein R2692_03630 [Microbacterium sp.]
MASPGGASGEELPARPCKPRPTSCCTHRSRSGYCSPRCCAVAGGLVAGAFGGWRAARLSPAEALRADRVTGSPTLPLSHQERDRHDSHRPAGDGCLRRPVRTRHRLIGVTKTYQQKGRVVRALKGVDVEIATGDFVTIQGPTGGGWSRPCCSCSEPRRAHDRARADRNKDLAAASAKSSNTCARGGGVRVQAFNLIRR